MLNNPSLDKLRDLRLTGMALAFEEQLAKPQSDLDFETRFGILVEREWYQREERRLKKRLQQAHFQQSACIEDIKYTPSRQINKSQVMELSRCQWIRNHLNILITGSSGCGKTYLACALAHKACLTGFSSRYHRLPRLLNALKVAKADGSYSTLLSQLAKVDVLILDDWGLVSLDGEQRRDLLEILDDRYQHRSTIITSQLPVEQWHEYLSEATLADAILDRLVHNANRIELQGGSLRKENTHLQNIED